MSLTAAELINDIIEENTLNSYIGTYDDKDFLVLEGWDDKKTIEENLGKDLDGNIAYGFSDEYTTCSNCGKIVKTSADSYSWTPDYVVFQGCMLLCTDCIDIDDYIEELKNNPKNANVIFDESDFVEKGFIKLNDDEYESGWHGTNDDPTEIFENLSSKYEEIIFSITNTSQFSTNFVTLGRYPIAN